MEMHQFLFLSLFLHFCTFKNPKKTGQKFFRRVFDLLEGMGGSLIISIGGRFFYMELF